jgi:hypothetical protein
MGGHRGNQCGTEAAQRTYRVTQAALLDGQVTTGEAREIVEGALATVRLAEDSLARNVAVERELTEFARYLADWRPETKARVA